MGRRHGIFLFPLLIATASAPLSAATINVSPGGCTLHDAIRAANADASRGDCSAGSGIDTIILPDGHAVVVGGTALATINSPMTIRTASGGSASITDDSHRVLEISGTSNVTLQNLLLSGGGWDAGNGSGGSGLRVNDSSSVQLIDVRIENNYRKGGFSPFGGGIHATGSSLTLERCEFVRNKVSSTSATSRGGNIYLKDSSATIIDSSLRGYPFRDADFFFLLQSGAELGAGLYAENSSVEIRGSLLENHRGADIHLTDHSSALLINSTLYHDNQDIGTRIFLNDGSTLDFNNSTLFQDDYGIQNTSCNGCDAVSVSASNSVFVNNGYLPTCVFRNHVHGTNHPLPFESSIANLFPPDDDSCGAGFGDSEQSLVRPPVDQGGPTHSPRLIASPDNLAINNGNTASCESVDQRGFPRGADCDIGAVELDDVTDLALDLSLVTPPPYYQGQLIEYLATVSNLGPADVYEVDLSFSLQGSNVDHYLSLHDCSGLQCSIDAIGNGGSAGIRLFVFKNGAATFDAQGVVNNVTGFSTDPNIANNTDDSGNGGSVSPVSNLEITQTLQTSPPHFIGQDLTFNVAVHNQGPNPAAGVEVVHALDGLAAVSSSGCDSTGGGICVINNINAGVTRNLQFVLEITDSTPRSTVSVSSDNADPDLSDNSDIDVANTQTDADISVTLTPITAQPYRVNDYLQFQATIANAGPDTATNILLNVDDENLVITDAGFPCSILPCEIASLSNGASINVTLGGVVPSAGSLSLELDVLSDQNDADDTDNSDTLQATVEPSADVQIQLAHPGLGPFYVGSVLDYTITVRNNGSLGASGVSVDAITGNLELLSVASLNCGALPCTIDAMEVGAANQEVIAVTARITDEGSATMTATVAANEYDDVTANNQASTAAQSVPAPKQPEVFRDGFEELF
ncbi:MAG: choice-of-anchor Q domain-containing protein [Lysobacteraceae bacterium]